jgi:hypothetical protein
MGVRMNSVNTRRHFLFGLSGADFGFLLLPKTSLADVGGAELAAKRSRVIASCTKHWPDNQGDCSAFVRGCPGARLGAEGKRQCHLLANR